MKTIKSESKTNKTNSAENLLFQYKYLQEVKSKTDKHLKELKEEIQKNIKPGQYGDYILAFETREVREYVVPSRVDHIVKVSKI